jgi:hypothetical protein
LDDTIALYLLSKHANLLLSALNDHSPTVMHNIIARFEAITGLATNGCTSASAHHNPLVLFAT